MDRLSPVEGARGIRALGDAVAAADAAIVILDDNAVGAFVGGAHGAAAHARWVVALHAGTRQKVRPCRLIVGDFKNFDPLLHGWDEVHRGAGFGAVAAAVALGEVNNHDPFLVAGSKRPGRKHLLLSLI